MRILPEQVHSSKQQPLDKIFVLLSANFLFFGKNFLESLSPSRSSLHLGFRFAFTWGYSWCRLYEIEVALRSFGQASGDLKRFSTPSGCSD